MKDIGTPKYFAYYKLFLLFPRFLGGMADAAAWGAVVSILMKLFPNHVTVIASWTEMLLGLGYMLGRCGNLDERLSFVVLNTL